MSERERPDTNADVAPSRLSKAAAKRVVQEIAANADNEVLISHAKQRMR